MAQRIEGQIILSLDRAEFQAINLLLYGLSDNRPAIDSLHDATNGAILLGPDDRKVLEGLWKSIHGLSE